MPARSIKQQQHLRMNCDINPEKDMSEDRMLKWFEYEHLPTHLQQVSIQFHSLATTIVSNIESGPERTVALRKLLEAKDAAVRATIHPKG